MLISEADKEWHISKLKAKKKKRKKKKRRKALLFINFKLTSCLFQKTFKQISYATKEKENLF